MPLEKYIQLLAHGGEKIKQIIKSQNFDTVKEKCTVAKSKRLTLEDVYSNSIYIKENGQSRQEHWDSSTEKQGMEALEADRGENFECSSLFKGMNHH